MWYTICIYIYIIYIYILYCIHILIWYIVDFNHPHVGSISTYHSVNDHHFGWDRYQVCKPSHLEKPIIDYHVSFKLPFPGTPPYHILLRVECRSHPISHEISPSYPHDISHYICLVKSSLLFILPHKAKAKVIVSLFFLFFPAFAVSGQTYSRLVLLHSKFLKKPGSYKQWNTLILKWLENHMELYWKGLNHLSDQVRCS